MPLSKDETHYQRCTDESCNKLFCVDYRKNFKSEQPLRTRREKEEAYDRGRREGRKAAFGSMIAQATYWHDHKADRRVMTESKKAFDRMRKWCQKCLEITGDEP